jgi:putative membrane-bound dehydrogenase-like protein
LSGPVSAAQFKFPNQTLTVPDGFEVELVAQSPLVDRPISGSFDEQGRLYLTDSSGSNEKPDKQLEEKPHRIVRLEDTDGDGKFDKTILFADKMMFPEGCLWYNGSLYVSAPPSIWKLTDTNGDGVADVREEWHKGETLTGCANDLHGPYLGPDGWIYWSKGAFAKQSYDLPNGKKFESRAAHIFRARPDHSDLEPVLTGGMDNPVGLAFTPEGERILCGTFFVTHEPGHRDGLIHAIYGGVYGKINEVTDSHKKTGDLMPVMTHMGPAAPCSVIRCESKVFGEEYQNNLFCCSFNLHKVSRHILVPDGATFKTQDSDFLTSDNPDFHPTDVIEDADGSLIVLNTGGWYKICCPTSQLSKPDVLGAVYRVRRKNAQKIADPRGLKLVWKDATPEELAKRLHDARLAVRKRAMAELGEEGPSSVKALAETLRTSKSADVRQNAVWTLTRIKSDEAREAVRFALNDTNAGVRHAACHSAGLWRDAKALDRLCVMLNDESYPKDYQISRVAAEALGRIGNVKATAALLNTFGKFGSLYRVHDHSLIYALIEIGDVESLERAVSSDDPFYVHAALIALDQIDGSRLKASVVGPLLGSKIPRLRRVASWVAEHHPDWGDSLSGFFEQKLKSDLSPPQRQELAQQLVQFSHAEAIQNLLGRLLESPESAAETKRLALQVMAEASVKTVPAIWTREVRTNLASENPSLLLAAVATAHALSAGKTNAPHFPEELMRIAREQKYPADLRLEALAAMPSLRSVESDLFSFLQANVDPEKSVLLRNSAVTVLAKARLTQEQLLLLTDTVRNAGPLEMTKLLGAFEHSANEAVGLKLIAALKDAKGLSSLRADLLKTLAAKYPETVRKQADELAATLNADAARQSAHIDELLPQLKEGDIRRGQLVFNSSKAACSSCHTVGYLGGKVGPDLTSIGQVRTERDLLESIVYPSASFVRSFEPYLVQTKSDETFSGVLKKDAADEVVLATGPGAEVRIARSNITDIRPGTVSVMPAGLEQQLTKQELADLLAFLKSTKWGPR